MKRFLCAWLRNWPLQRLESARPELRAKPVVLYEAGRRGGWQVVVCSRQAAERGVAAAMPLAEALALAGGDATGFHLEKYDPLADHFALQQLARWCQRFSPVVALEESDAPDSLFLDVTGCERLFHGEEKLADRVVREFCSRGLVVRVAIADTIGAAWAMAHYGRLDSRLSAPAGLEKLPVEALRLPEETVETLHQLGIERIGQLESLPRSSLSARFGPHLVERLDQAMGGAPEVLTGYRTPPPVQADWTAEHPTDQGEVVQHVIDQLIERVAGTLAHRRQGVQQLQCRMRCEQGQSIKISVGLFRPTASSRHLRELLRLQLERLSLTEPISAIDIRATATAPLECRQQEMFESLLSRHALEWLAALLDRLSNRLGRPCVLKVSLAPDAQPEYACRAEPMIGTKSRESRVESREFRTPIRKPGLHPVPGRPPTFDVQPSTFNVRRSASQLSTLHFRLLAFDPRLALLARPLHLAPEPIAVAAMSVVPDGPPIRFELAGREHRIIYTCGPERIETGWWRGRSARRDYYRVETNAGACCWLFRRLIDGRWFLHGWFD